MPRMYKESNNLIAIKIQFENGQYSQVNDQQVPRLKKKKKNTLSNTLIISETNQNYNESASYTC